MKIVALFTGVILALATGCDQVAYRAVGLVPEPAQRVPLTEATATATVTLAGPRDRVERILHLIVERDPEVHTLVELRVK